MQDMKTILVIEDDRSIRKNLIRMLNQSGFDVLVAEQGKQGVELAELHLPDLIVCDILMPELDGFGVLAALRQNPETVAIPFIFLSARSDLDEIRQGMNLGADDYLTKPFTAQQLLATIQTRLEKQAAIAQPLLNQLKKTAESLSSFAHYDPLTGLPNRILLHHRLQEAMQINQGDEPSLALCTVRLKLVNVAKGWLSDLETAIIQEIIARLKSCVGTRNLLARLGQWEFAIVMTDINHLSAISALTQTLLETITAPYHLDGYGIGIQAWVGIACYPEHGTSPGQLLERSEQAVQWCQQQTEKRRDDSIDSRIQVFNRLMETADTLRHQLKADLKTALEQAQFQLHFQPQFSLLSGRIIGVEALLRWHHPTKGIIAPDEIMPLAQEIGMMETLEQWVIQTACEEAKAWQAYSLLPLPVSVNLSGHQLYKASLTETLKQTLRQTQLSPRLFALEVTESCILPDPDYALMILNTLKESGISIHIDNYGIGSLSLNWLSQLPVDCLKIDRSFVMAILESQRHEQVIKAMIQIAQSFRLRAIAEGVETEEQLVFLQQHGCYGMQGFFYSPPMPSRELQNLLIREKQLNR